MEKTKARSVPHLRVLRRPLVNQEGVGALSVDEAANIVVATLAGARGQEGQEERATEGAAVHAGLRFRQSISSEKEGQVFLCRRSRTVLLPSALDSLDIFIRATALEIKSGRR